MEICIRQIQSAGYDYANWQEAIMIEMEEGSWYADSCDGSGNPKREYFEEQIYAQSWQVYLDFHSNKSFLEDLRIRTVQI